MIMKEVNRNPIPAFTTPISLARTSIPLGSYLTRRQSRPTAARRRLRQPLALARTRIDPKDEAFITCPSCGSDSLLSATTILQKGTLPIRCTQCNTRFTARAENALTTTGKKLTSIVVDNEEEDSKTEVVKLYISGLPPKTGSEALKNTLEEFGQVLSANVIYDRVTRRSRGFGFVTILGRSAAMAAMDVLSGDSSRFGRRLNVKEAVDR